jgi:hypothetical protein
LNRLTITLTPNGEIDAICADSPLEVYIVAPHVPHDRVYLYGSTQVGPQFVQQQIGGYAVGHAGDGTLGEFEAAHLPPSKPALTIVAINEKPSQTRAAFKIALDIARQASSGQNLADAPPNPPEAP